MVVSFCEGEYECVCGVVICEGGFELEVRRVWFGVLVEGDNGE